MTQSAPLNWYMDLRDTFILLPQTLFTCPNTYSALLVSWPLSHPSKIFTHLRSLQSKNNKLQSANSLGCQLLTTSPGSPRTRFPCCSWDPVSHCWETQPLPLTTAALKSTTICKLEVISSLFHRMNQCFLASPTAFSRSIKVLIVSFPLPSLWKSQAQINLIFN